MQAAHSPACSSAHIATRPVCSSSSRSTGRPSRLLRLALKGTEAHRTPAVPTDKQTAAEADTPATSRQGLGSSLSHGLDQMGTLVNNLLINAATWRVVRGQTHCLCCKGTGREVCSACQGSGIMQPEKVRMTQFDGDWLKSNRCRCCHGTGAVPCTMCNGTGRMGPSQ